MIITAGWQRRAAGRGFTLIELLLTLVLLLLLVGAAVVNFTALQSSAQLDEAAEQLSSAIRFARAHAANTGCKVRFTFEELVDEDLAVPLGNIFVEWEPDPVRQPGVFKPLREIELLVESLMQAAEIENVIAHDAGGAVLMTGSAEGEEGESAVTFAPITFYPDGSSDSAEIIIGSRDENETRRISLTLVGVTGVLRKVELTDGETAEDQELLDWFYEE